MANHSREAGQEAVSKDYRINSERDRGRIDGLAFAIAVCRQRATLYDNDAGLQQTAIFLSERLAEIKANSHDKRKVKNLLRSHGQDWISESSP